MPTHTLTRSPDVATALTLITCAALWAPPTTAAADGDAIYQGAPARVTANVELWGADCGVQPKSYTLNERPRVPVRRVGDHLALDFPSGTVHSNRCWSQNPALQLVSTSARAGAWKTRCETPAGDPKRETGVYEVLARDETTLELTESSRYDWQLKESHCVATVRTVRTLTRISPPDPAQDLPVAQQNPVETSGPARDDCVAGSLASLRLLPAKARVEPGANLCFSVQGKDAQGCAIKQPPVTWSVKPLDHGQGRMIGHCFRSAGSAAEGEGRFRITATTGHLTARALVRVATQDLSDITLHDLPDGQGRTPAADGALDGAEGIRAETRVAARALEDAGKRGLWLGALAAAMALLGVTAAFVAARKRRSALAGAPEGPSFDQPREASPPPPATPPIERAPAPATPSVRPTEPMICPRCRRGYAPGAERCEGDGTPLITYKAFTAQAAPRQVRCSACGASFDDGSTFCGRCGAPLSP